MTEAMPFLQKTILLSYDPRPFRAEAFFILPSGSSRCFAAGMPGAVPAPRRYRRFAAALLHRFAPSPQKSGLGPAPAIHWFAPPMPVPLPAADRAVSCPAAPAPLPPPVFPSRPPCRCSTPKATLPWPQDFPRNPPHKLFLQPVICVLPFRPADNAAGFCLFHSDSSSV